MSKDIHINPQTSTNQQSKHFGVQETCRELSGTMIFLGCSELPYSLPKDTKAKKLQIGHKNARLLANHWIKKRKTRTIIAAAKFEISLILEQIEKSEFARVNNSDTRPNFFVQSARQSCLVKGQRNIWGWKICFMRCFGSTYDNKIFNLVHFFPRFIFQ